MTLPAGLPAGFPFVSATATTQDGETSEFSAVCGDPNGNGNVDDDNDWLCDDWETRGIDWNGDGPPDLNLAALGAQPWHKDIFIEIDYMQAVDHNHQPNSLALLDFGNAFTNTPSIVNLDGKPASPCTSWGHLRWKQVTSWRPSIQTIIFQGTGPGTADDFNDLNWNTPAEALRHSVHRWPLRDNCRPHRR